MIPIRFVSIITKPVFLHKIDQMPDFNIISRCPIFREIHPNEIEVLFNQIHFQVRSFTKDEIVVTAGESVQYLYVVLAGHVRGEMIDYSGKVVKIEDIEAPQPLASAFLFGQQNRFPVTVTANTDARLLAIPVPEFLKLLQINAQILINYLNSISTRTQFLSQKIYFLSFKTIREKIAHFLLKKAGDKLHSIEIRETQQQLADLFGVTRPALARVLGEMQSEGIIRIERKTIELTDRKRLNQLLHHE